MTAADKTRVEGGVVVQISDLLQADMGGERVPVVSSWGKCREVARLGFTRARVELRDLSDFSTDRRSRRPLSDSAAFARAYVTPLFIWWGANLRVLKGPSLGRVAICNGQNGDIQIINGASHNYAGFYKSTDDVEALQHHCLDVLPVSSTFEIPLLRNAMHQALAAFFNTDFCLTTSTGYGSNYVALPALASMGKRTVVLADMDCHNSIFTGVFIASTSVRKFRHNDMKHLKMILDEIGVGFDHVILVVEGMYSMEGDIASLNDLHQLKMQYGFTVYCDEAHSFFTLGKTGRGCLELWNERHPLSPVPQDLFDIRTATLSKSAGGIGGIIVGRSKFEEPIRRHMSVSDQSSLFSIPTSTMVQMMVILQSPQRTSHHLQRLAAIARLCRSELRRSGVYVYGDSDTPILPVWAGRPSVAARLSYELRKAGLLASPVSTPAVPIWASRVRINLSADLTHQDIHQLIHAVVSSAQKCGILHRKAAGTLESPNSAEKACGSIADLGCTPDLQDACQAVKILLSTSIQQWSSPVNSLCKALLDVGHKSRLQYGIGSGSARWISGTFPSHLSLEGSLTRFSGTDETMLYPDASIGLSSTVAALARPLSGFAKHIIFVPVFTSQSVRDGLIMGISKAKAVVNEIKEYRDVIDLLKMLQQTSRRRQRACYTIHLHVRADSQTNAGALYFVSPSDVHRVLTDLCHIMGSFSRSTILLDWPSHIVDLIGPSAPRLYKNFHLLIYGNFRQCLGLPGGYLTGSRSLVTELRYTSRGYMFTTSMPPFVADMARAWIEMSAERTIS